MDGDQDVTSGEMVGDDEHVGAGEPPRTVPPGFPVRVGDSVKLQIPAKADRPPKIVYTTFSNHCSGWAWPFKNLTKTNKAGQSKWVCKADEKRCPFSAVLTMNEVDSSFTAQLVVPHHDDCPRYTDPKFTRKEKMRAAVSNYRKRTADQARGDVGAGGGGRDGAEMDLVEEAGDGAGAAVGADHPPPVAGGGMVAEGEAMEGAGAGLAADQPPLLAGGGQQAQAMDVVVAPAAGAGPNPSTPDPSDSSDDSSWHPGSNGSSPDEEAVLPKCRAAKKNFHELESFTSMRAKCSSMVTHIVRPEASEEEKLLAVGVFCQHMMLHVGRIRNANHLGRISAMLKAMFRDDQRGRMLRLVLEQNATESTRQHRLAAGKKSPTHIAGKRKKYTRHLI